MPLRHTGIIERAVDGRQRDVQALTLKRPGYSARRRVLQHRSQLVGVDRFIQPQHSPAGAGTTDQSGRYGRGLGHCPQ
jgi:hypothetical protein